MISVVTPVYNGEKFIESCIKVVIAQNCPDVEHIIVDGGSKDGTVEIIKQYAQKYSHIRWISEKDKGQSDAMNKGIAMAQGEILAILNVDDYYEPNVLNRVSEIFKTLPEPSLLVGNCNVWNDEGRIIHLNKPSKLEFSELLLIPYKNYFPMNPSAYFYHISLHQKIGFYKIEEH
ncbi:MAG: glycosyltransferase family 2 protein, partial [Scytonema sp. PMC 1069.18]|nr:glycosyltransferase family 2 protein [Scytonema sp. PMC 1069.18]